MKILFVSITDSGILRVRSELIDSLINKGHKVIVVTPKEKAYKELIAKGCKVYNISIQQHGKNPLADFHLFLQYKRMLQLIKPNVVLSFTTKPNVYCGIACRLNKIPVIMNITGMGSALGGKGMVQQLLILLYKLACNGSNMKCIFFQNDDSKNFFKERRIGKQKLYQRIPGSGVNLERYTPQPFPNSDTIDFLFVARVMKEKGIDEYIKAAKCIRKRYPEAIFHVLGDSDKKYKDILYRETQKGSIIYHGRVNNMVDYEMISQCTIQPSYYPEGMSNVILEAAASARPVITTDHPGCREGVDNGKTGFIVPVRNVTELVKAIDKFIQLPLEMRIKMGKDGRIKMENEFDRKLVTNAYLKEIREIMK